MMGLGVLRRMFLTDLVQPAEPVLQVPGVGDAALVEVMELVQRDHESRTRDGAAKPLTGMPATDFGTNPARPTAPTTS